jgi:dUTP pyrophosphatase
MTDSVFKGNTVGRFIALENPRRKTVGSAGYDFKAPETVVIPAHKYIQFDSGVRVEMRPGYVLNLYIRSSLGRRGLTLTNSVGIIDSDFKGIIQAFIMNNSDEDYTIYKGERYMQGIFTRYFITDDDRVEALRTGGIGSTGK